MLYGYKKASIHTKFHEEEDGEIGDQADAKQPQAEFQFSQHGATAPGFHALPLGMTAKGEDAPGYLGTPQQGKDTGHEKQDVLNAPADGNETAPTQQHGCCHDAIDEADMFWI